MTSKSIRKIFPLLAIILLASWPAAYAQSCNDDVTAQDAAQIVLICSSVTEDLTSAQGPSRSYSYPISKTRDYVESNTGGEFPLQLYVTPEDQTIGTLAVQINGAQDAYKEEVGVALGEIKLGHVEITVRGMDECTLKLYLWDVSSGRQKLVPGSMVDTTGDYGYGTTKQLSKYGGFGSAAPPAPSKQLAKPVNWPLIWGIVVVVIILNLLLWFVLFRRRAR